MPRKPKAGRPKSPRAKKRSCVVTIWLTPPERAAVAARVKADKTSVSEWFRSHGLGPLGLSAPAVAATSDREGGFANLDIDGTGNRD